MKSLHYAIAPAGEWQKCLKKYTPPSWRSLKSHWAIDFASVFDSQGIQLFVFSIIEIPSRKLILINSTANPSREWLLQKFRNYCIQEHTFPEFMMYDRDGIYSHWLRDAVAQFNCQSFKTA